MFHVLLPQRPPIPSRQGATRWPALWIDFTLEYGLLPHLERAGRDNLCKTGYQGTYLSSNAGIWGKEAHNEHGCFAELMHVPERFAFKIPDGMTPETTAPLLCAGITVWEPISDYVRPNSRVGVVSLGGLGHMAVQFALAVGAEVWALSSSTSKEERIKRLGAHHFVLSKDPDALNAIAGTLDVIIDTCPVAQDISPYMEILAIGGTYCKVGIPTASFSYDCIPLVFTQKRIAGSIVSVSSRTNEMLALAAHHGIHCDVEVMSFDMINEAIERLLKGENQNFRIVLKW